jgi:hypothetical protein
MNGFTIKNIIYLLFISSVFYFLVGKIFKLIKFKKLNKLKKGIYFSIFILLFYFFYKTLPVLLFGNNKIIEGMLMDDLSESQTKAEKKNEETGKNINYEEGWDNADNFKKTYCSKTPTHLDKMFFTDTSKETGNPDGGLVYGLKNEIFDEQKKEYRSEFSEALKKQITKGNIFDTDSFTKDNKCFTNLKEDDGKTATNTQLCKPDCRFKFKVKSNTETTKK